MHLEEAGMGGGRVGVKTVWPNVILVIASLITSFIIGEVAIRMVHPNGSLWRYPNYIEAASQPRQDQQPRELLRHSPTLGFEPKPGASGNLMNHPISYSADGLRNQNADMTLSLDRPVLAVGDSYTEGFGVGNDDAWPAALERKLRRRVLNGGVRGYGLDQIVLRAEELIPKVQPGTVVLAFIADDIRRATLSVYESRPKPFFTIAGRSLELHNVPVSEAPALQHKTWRWILGHSFLLDYIMRRLHLQAIWYGDDTTGQDGPVLACLLMHRFASATASLTALVVAQPQYDAWLTTGAEPTNRRLVTDVLACAREAGLNTLNLYDVFEKAGARDDPSRLYVDWHFNAAGNRLVADAIAQQLHPERTLPSLSPR